MIWPTPEDYIRVPDTMRHPRVKRWVCFRCIPQPDGRVQKTPLTMTGRLASIADPRTWSNFEDCLVAMNRCVGNSLGFALGADYKLILIDLDKCILPDGTINATAQKYIDHLKPAEPYIERSISGRGIHLFTWYSGRPRHYSPEEGVEVFTEGQFAVLTGVPL